jgi:hypothetical protein
MSNSSKEPIEIRKPPVYLYYLAAVVLLFLVVGLVYYFGYYRYMQKYFLSLVDQNVNKNTDSSGEIVNQSQETSGQKIYLDQPQANQVVTNPMIIKSRTREITNLNLRIKDADGRILGETKITTSPAQLNSFYEHTTMLSYATSTSEFGLIEAFELDQGDSVQDLVSVKIKFANFGQPPQDETATWKVYDSSGEASFYNEKYVFTIKTPSDFRVLYSDLGGIYFVDRNEESVFHFYTATSNICQTNTNEPGSSINCTNDKLNTKYPSIIYIFNTDNNYKGCLGECIYYKPNSKYYGVQLEVEKGYFYQFVAQLDFDKELFYKIIETFNCLKR